MAESLAQSFWIPGNVSEDYGRVRIYPVLDLLNGVVVRAVAGERGNYRPIVSPLVQDTAPLSVARAFRSEFGLHHLYLADLDAILHQRANSEVYRALREDGFDVMVDAGFRTGTDVRSALAAGASSAIIGLETCPNRRFLSDLLGQVNPARLVFSLDLRAGDPLGSTDSWGTNVPSDIARQVFDAGIWRMIVLDLAGVGVGAGVPTFALCQKLRNLDGDFELITGGGVRQMDDLRQLAEAGIDGALIATALHDGSLRREDLMQFREP